MGVLNSVKLRVFAGIGFVALVIYTLGLLPILINWYLDILMPIPRSWQSEEIEYEASLNTSELIALYGYPVEEYAIETDDGYILTLQRIPGPGNNDRKPVLLIHGMSCSSSVWIDNLNESVGFILADAGFDVWLGNFRGNPNSLRHVTMTHDDPEFWKFNVDKLAFYDLPAMIDFVRSKTNKDKILLAGHSMGSTAPFGTFTIRPEYNDKVHGFVALAPVATVGYITSILQKLVSIQYMLQFGTELMNLHHVYKPSPLLREILKHLCGRPGGYWCSNLYPAITGYNPYFFNKTRAFLYGMHCSGGLAIDVVFQFGQMVDSKDFRFFDYNDEHKNLRKYGTQTPPVYNLSLVTVPTALFWSSNDALSDPLDVALLIKVLPNVVVNYHLPTTMFNHFNFYWSFNIRTHLTDKLIETLIGFDRIKSRV